MVFVAASLMLAGCTGGDESAEQVETRPNPTVIVGGEEHYAIEVGTAIGELVVGAEIQASEVELAFLTDGVDRGLDTAAAENAGLLDLLDDTIERIRSVPPPVSRENAHRDLAAGLVSIRSLVVDRGEAAETGDLGQFQLVERTIDDEREALIREADPDIATLVIAARADDRTTERLTEDELSFLEEVALATNEFSTRNNALGRRTDTSYGGSAEFFDALLESGAGTAFEAVRDRAVELTPPSSLGPDHERWLSYLDEVAELDGDVEAAAMSRDVEAFSRANTAIAIAGAQLSRDVSEAMALAIGPPKPPLPALAPDDEAGRALQVHLAYLSDVHGVDGVAPQPGPFSADEKQRAQAVAAGLMHPELERIGAAIESMDAGRWEGDVVGVLAYLDQIQTVAERTSDGTPSALDELLTTWCETGRSLTPDFAKIAVVHFAGATTDPECTA